MVGWLWCWLALAGGLVEVGAGELVEGWIEVAGGAGLVVWVVDADGCWYRSRCGRVLYLSSPLRLVCLVQTGGLK